MSMTDAIIIDTEGMEPATVQAIKDAVARILADADIAEPAPDAVRGWTRELANILDGRLRTRGRSVQADVIAAAAQAGGYIDREQVYEIGGYGPERSLNGFTKPVTGVMRELNSEGLLPADAAHPMSPAYDPNNASFQRALGFYMPPEIAELFSSITPQPRVRMRSEAEDSTLRQAHHRPARLSL